jgi:transposase
LDYSAYPVKEVEKNLKKMIRELEKAISQLENTIDQLIKEDGALWPKAKKLLTIKGVGLKTIAVLLAETNGFSSFENQGQLVSYSGTKSLRRSLGKEQVKPGCQRKAMPISEGQCICRPCM